MQMHVETESGMTHVIKGFWSKSFSVATSMQRHENGVNDKTYRPPVGSVSRTSDWCAEVHGFKS